MRRSQRDRPPRNRAIPYAAAQIQMRVVFPRDADTAEHLNAVLGVGLGGLDPGGGGDGRGDRQLLIVGVGGRGCGGSGCITGGH